MRSYLKQFYRITSAGKLSLSAPAVYGTNEYLFKQQNIFYKIYLYLSTIHYFTVTVEGSTLTPGPIVEATVTFFI
jgi:hypothetical protein